MSEIREAAAEALWQYAFDGTVWAVAVDDQRDEARSAADAVLAAVTPLIRAEALRGLVNRASVAVERVDLLADASWKTLERVRLHGKAEGVRLVLSYIHEALREASK